MCVRLHCHLVSVNMILMVRMLLWHLITASAHRSDFFPPEKQPAAGLSPCRFCTSWVVCFSPYYPPYHVWKFPWNTQTHIIYAWMTLLFLLRIVINFFTTPEMYGYIVLLQIALYNVSMFYLCSFSISSRFPLFFIHTFYGANWEIIQDTQYSCLPRLLLRTFPKRIMMWW